MASLMEIEKLKTEISVLRGGPSVREMKEVREQMMKLEEGYLA